MSKIQRAILSVTDKTGLVDFARKLSGLGIELISTGGTAKLLRDAQIKVKDISELTGFPEMLDGRVKTLHPKVHGGILHRREDPKHVAAVAEHGIPPIDMVVVNLYAFEKTAAKPGVAFDELIENIDIGGPSMIRSAAKNFRDVAVVTSPADYDAIADELSRTGSALSNETKWRLAQKAFATTAAYDSAIASTLERIPAEQSPVQPDAASFPQTLRFTFQKKLDLRYGENPHQKAAMYSDGSGCGRGQCASNFRARNSPTTTSSTCKLPGIWRRNLTSPNLSSRSAPSSSTPIRAAQPPAKPLPKPTSALSNATPSRPSAA